MSQVVVKPRNLYWGWCNLGRTRHACTLAEGYTPHWGSRTICQAAMARPAHRARQESMPVCRKCMRELRAGEAVRWLE